MGMPPPLPLPLPPPRIETRVVRIETAIHSQAREGGGGRELVVCCILGRARGSETNPPGSGLEGMSSAGPRIKHRVSYFHDAEAGQFYLGPSHPMKPHRVQLAHQIILGYELHNKMVCFVSTPLGLATPFLHFCDLACRTAPFIHEGCLDG